MYHSCDRTAAQSAAQFIARGFYNVYLLEEGLEKFIMKFPDLVFGKLPVKIQQKCNIMMKQKPEESKGSLLRLYDKQQQQLTNISLKKEQLKMNQKAKGRNEKMKMETNVKDRQKLASFQSVDKTNKKGIKNIIPM